MSSLLEENNNQQQEISAIKAYGESDWKKSA